MRKRFATSLVACLAGTALAAAPASAAVLADWEMNEPAGATVMQDSSGNHLNGQIGSSVTTGFTVLGATGYHWPFRSPTAPPADPGRLVVVNNNSLLNPGTGTYSVTFRYRTNQHFGNMIQKGQAGAGAYFKIENPNGQINCVFRGRNSSGSLVRRAVQEPTATSDNQWHVVTCTRTSTGLTLTVDGKVVATAKGNTGNVSNTRPITIAGKLNCDNIKTTCDYYTGDIDWVKLSN
jgi:concanavalin A-like lectin/glucanase superfamily protein